MTPAGRAAALFCVLSLAASHAAAQAVRGTVTSADDGRPIAGAAVLLLDSLAARFDSVATDSAGAFRLAADAPGTFFVHVAPPGYLSTAATVILNAGDTTRLAIAMPVISEAAAGVMRDVIDRETAFQLPWEELCGEPVRPWEAGVLVGVARDRGSMRPLPRAVVRLQLLDPDATPPGAATADPAAVGPDSVAAWARTRVATATGAFWFCNVPPGRVRVTARAEGHTDDSWVATIRAGTISWYDALLP